MPIRNISLTPEQDAFIKEVVEAGEYRNASEAVCDAIRVLQQRRAEDALKLDRLSLSIRQGVAAPDRGDYADVDDEDLDAYLDEPAGVRQPPLRPLKGSGRGMWGKNSTATIRRLRDEWGR